MQKVLVVDDDKVLQQSVKLALEFQQFVVEVASSGEEALQKVFNNEYDLVLMDVNMPGKSGIETLVEIKKYNPAIIVLIFTAYSNVSDAVKAVKEGAFNYLEKPISSENLVALIKRALKAKNLVETTAFSAPRLSLGEDDQEEGQFVGRSHAMKKIFFIIERLAKVSTPVLIRGESGTGKELVAKAIHYNGPRKEGKFVVINCGAIPENLIESELFGHEKGAFTGATERKIGKFLYANGGTLFLDEIGDISAAMQVKLLRVLQEQKFTPLGSNREVQVDVRVIAASNKNFEEMIKLNEFREDLFYRLNVLPVYLPPLRERKSDIPLLIDYYIDHFNKVHELTVAGVGESAREILENFDWPGNIRQLKNVIEHAFIMESGDRIEVTSLPAQVVKDYVQAHLGDKKGQTAEAIEEGDEEQSELINFSDLSRYPNDLMNPTDDQGLRDQYHFHFPQISEGESSESKLDFQLAKDLFEKQFITEALKRNRGKINKTALNANIPKKTLLRKIEKYHISPKDFY